jgi:hypothetical protein
MDENGFRNYLIKGGRSTSAVNRCLGFLLEFEEYLQQNKLEKSLDDAQSDDLVEFVVMLDASSKTKAKKYLWAIRYYCDFTSNDELRDLAARLRAERIDSKPFPIKGFRSVDPRYVEKLAEVGIKNVNQMLAAGGTLKARKLLAQSTGIPPSSILEFVKLSDLARIPGVKGIRAGLYYDAGIDSVETIAKLEPEELHEIVVDYIVKTGFDGVPTLPAEAKFTVEEARKLPSNIEY